VPLVEYKEVHRIETTFRGGAVNPSLGATFAI